MAQLIAEMEHSHPRSGQEPYAKPLKASEPLVWALADALKGKQTDVSAMKRRLGALIRHGHAKSCYRVNGSTKLEPRLYWRGDHNV